MTRPRMARRLVACAALSMLAACSQTLPQIPQADANANAPTPGSVAVVAEAGGSPAMAGRLRGGAPGDTHTVQAVAQSFEQFDERQEIEIGRQLAALLLGSKPMLQDAPLQRYVNQLGRWISLQSTRPNLPWTFGVLDDPSFNAFATPGGYVFVTRGLVERMRDEAELGGVLAHEIMHVVHKHHLKALAASGRAQALPPLPAAPGDPAAGSASSAQMLALGRDLFARGLNRNDEFEADRQGTALAARAGLDPYGLLSTLQRLRGASSSDATFTLLLSTHPAADERVDRLETAMGRRLDRLGAGRQVTIAQRLGRAPMPSESPADVLTPTRAGPSDTRASPKSQVRPAVRGR